jgi:hypothetical protein
VTRDLDLAPSREPMRPHGKPRRMRAPGDPRRIRTPKHLPVRMSSRQGQRLQAQLADAVPTALVAA